MIAFSPPPPSPEPWTCPYCNKPFADANDHYRKPCFGLWVRIQAGKVFLWRQK